MSERITEQAPAVAAPGGNKGLAQGRLGFLACVVLGISTIAPVYTLTGALGPTVREVGTQLPAVFLVGFLPMLLVALGYRELNAADPDSGTSFTWSARAFGPTVGWIGGWGMVAATTIVLSNLAGVAVDFFYLFLAQALGRPELAELTGVLWINVLTCCLFIALAVWICCRGLATTLGVQYALVALQVLVLLGFCVAAFTLEREARVPSFEWHWFNPLAIESFSAFAAGLALSIFVYWGWDVCLTVTEEAVSSHAVPGRAATCTVLLILLLYLLTAVATPTFAGVEESGLGLGNPAIQENVFAHLAGPVLGPLAILMSVAVLASTAASLQSTFITPARTLFAMGHYRALPKRFAQVSAARIPRFATLCAGLAAGAFYVSMRLLSDNVLADTITALGMMICFYYALTAFACVWFFRHSLVGSLRHLLLRGLCPLVGGLALAIIFLQTAVDSLSPDFGSGSHIGGVGLVFVIALVIFLLGLALMLLFRWRAPAFFAGATLGEGPQAGPRR